MKRRALALIARLATWTMHCAAKWAKAETPEFAMRMRRRTKRRILGEKAEEANATAYPYPIDDIAPTAADTYMGFATMRAAQATLGGTLAVIHEYEARHILLKRQADALRKFTLEAIRILDESEVQK